MNTAKQHDTKHLAVFGKSGSGRKMLIGNLVYKFGMDMLLMEKLQRDGISKFHNLTSWLKQNGLPAKIHTPHHLVELHLMEDEAALSDQPYDGALYLVDLTFVDQQQPSMTIESNNSNQSADSAQSQTHSSSLIVLNKIDQVQYTEELFSRAKYYGHSMISEDAAERPVEYVAVSALHSTNILDVVQGNDWVSQNSHTSNTLIYCIDRLWSS